VRFPRAVGYHPASARGPGAASPSKGAGGRCFAKGRAALSRRGQVERLQLRDAEISALLEHAEQLETRAAELRGRARQLLVRRGES